MRYNPIGLDDNSYDWHYWFAWRPVWAIEGVWVWLERIERRKIEHSVPNCSPSWIWEYRVGGYPTTPNPED